MIQHSVEQLSEDFPQFEEGEGGILEEYTLVYIFRIVSPFQFVVSVDSIITLLIHFISKLNCIKDTERNSFQTDVISHAITYHITYITKMKFSMIK